MASFYSKYNLTNNNKDVNILKKNLSLDYTDYEKLKINEQYNRLYLNAYNENKKEAEIKENIKVYNLSFAELLKNSINVYIGLLNDISVLFDRNSTVTFNKLGIILTKNDNLMYIGILIFILAFLLWLINVTS
jgi:hypothetical protein